MKKRIVVGTLLGVAVFIACSPAALNTSGIKGLTAPVSITKDQWGVPHIRAKTDLDAFYAQGFVHAQDRLWQMELNRRIGAGRLSEILGTAALDQDKFLRTWGFYRAAQTAYPALEPRSKAILESYAAGVNAVIAQGNLPIEFSLLGVKPEPWQPADSLVWSKMLAFNLSSNWNNELENTQILEKLGLDGFNALKPQYSKPYPTILRAEDYQGKLNIPGFEPPMAKPTVISSALATAMQTVEATAKTLREQYGIGYENGLGSNNWVVAGSRTESGKPLLANDPHLAFQAPSLWYLADLKGDTLSAIGATLPGVPGVVLGRNERIAWGATNTAPDTQDLFLLELENGAYKTPNGMVKLETREEIFKVGGREEKHIIRSTAYGPIISDLAAVGVKLPETQAIALRFVALEPNDTTLDAFIGFNYAQNWNEFKTALRRYVTPQQNFVYADDTGNIGYYAPGKIPIRNWDGRFPATASTGANWSGYAAFEDLPNVVNPREGFIVTANNRTLPFGASLPEYSTYTEGYRAGRIRELILETPKHTVATMRAAQNDNESLVSRELIPGLLALTPKSEAAKRLQNEVRNWDNKANIDSTGATAFAFYYRELTRVLEDEIDNKYFDEPNFLIPAFTKGSPYCDDKRTTPLETCTVIMQNALENGAAALEKQLGSNAGEWVWRKVHIAQFNALIGSNPTIGFFVNRSIPTNGSRLTVNVGNYNQETLIQRAGVSFRSIFDFSSLNKSRYIHPMGQSGDPFSRDYDNLLPLWRDGLDIPMSQILGDWGIGVTLELKP
jgi:penicillin G amidase